MSGSTCLSQTGKLSDPFVKWSCKLKQAAPASAANTPGAWTKGLTPMASTNVARVRDSAQVRILFDSPEIAALIAQLEETRWTGRPGYPIRAMVGLALVKAMHTLPTWTRTVALVRDHAALREVLGAVPSVDAAYRFAAKLRKHDAMLTACIESVLAALREAKPGMGQVIAIDGSDLPAYANGQRFVKRGGEERKRFATRMHRGVTAHQFQLAQVAAITGTRFMRQSARKSGFPSRGTCAPLRTPSYPKSRCCWTP
jgi:Transposase domain (DUF772)